MINWIVHTRLPKRRRKLAKATAPAKTSCIVSARRRAKPAPPEADDAADGKVAEWFAKNIGPVSRQAFWQTDGASTAIFLTDAQALGRS